jgi:hypothetical protein
LVGSNVGLGVRVGVAVDAGLVGVGVGVDVALTGVELAVAEAVGTTVGVEITATVAVG